jgi:hypothetical protein
VKDRPSRKELRAFIKERASRALDRFDTPIGEHEWIDFEVHPDQFADVQLKYQADHASLYVDMELSDAKAVHAAMGRAIAEREEELRFFPREEEATSECPHPEDRIRGKGSRRRCADCGQTV